MAAHNTLALASGANNEDLLSVSARDTSHESDSDVAKTARAALETHPTKLAPMSGAAGASHTDTGTGTTDYLHNRYHSHHHHLHRHDQKPCLSLHRPHSKTPLNVSETSTPSRNRSPSSSIYTIPSTFPSSAPVHHSPIDGPSLHVTETGTDDIKSPTDSSLNLHFRVNAEPPSKNAISTAHDLQVQTTKSAPFQHKPHPPISPPATERDSGRSHGSPSNSPTQGHSPLQSNDVAADPGPCWKDKAFEDGIIGGHQPEGDSVYDIAEIQGAGVNGSEAGSIDSQTLALDQARLRITYLVSTMVVNPLANAPVDAMAIGAAPGIVEDAKDADLLVSTAPVPLYGCDELADQEASEVKHYMEQCPKGWNHIAAAKKREKITQVLYWQSEITELGDDSLFCGCSVGTSTAYDADDDSGAGCTRMVQSRRQASSDTGLPRLSTVASGVTTIGTSAAGLDRSSTASPSLSMTAPSSSLTSSLSCSPPPGSSSLRSSRPCCSGCKKLLMPPRTVIFVSSSTDDFPWVQRAEDDGRRNSGFRKAIRAIRGIMGLSKRKKDKGDQNQNGLLNPDVAKIANSGGGNALLFAVPDLTGVQLVGPASPMPSHRKKNISEAKVWDLWEKTNCDELRDHVEKDEWALFFPATEMYRSLRKDAESLEPASDKSPAEGEADIDANIDDIINDDDDDEHAKEQRKRRDMTERLQRAQALLEQHK